MTLSIPPWPVYSQDEIDAVTQVLKSAKGNYWFGNEGKQFEREFASYCGARFGLAVANGTVALELCLRSLGIGPGDEVITTPRSFIATANSIALCGAKPVFADVDLDSQNITPDSVQPLITDNTRAILAVHLAGWPCDMAGLKTLAEKHQLSLIEDCAQAHGASIDGTKVGVFGDVAAFSFCHDKIMSTGGEGGMLVSNNEALWARAATFRNHGRDPRKVSLGSGADDYFYCHDSIGSNYRLTELQSAIGRIQLGKLDRWLQERQQNAKLLTAALAHVNAVRLTIPPENVAHAYYKFYVFLDKKYLCGGWNRARIISALHHAGVPCETGVCPHIYNESVYKNISIDTDAEFPNAKELGETSLAFLIHPGTGEELMSKMADSICSVLAEVG